MSFVDRYRIRKFLSRSLFLMYVSSTIGFFAGVKICDYIFFEPLKFEIMREEMEDEFWAANGEPEYIKPYIVNSIKDETKQRKSWIYIMFDKDRMFKKKDEISL